MTRGEFVQVEPCAKCAAVPTCLIRVAGYKGGLCWTCYKKWLTDDAKPKTTKGKSK